MEMEMEKEREREAEGEGEGERESTTTILDLSIYELHMIFDNLEFNDSVNLASTHPILQDAYCALTRKKYRHISLPNIEENHFSTVMEWLGDEVVSVRGPSAGVLSDSNTLEMMRLGARCFPNLEFVEVILNKDNIHVVEQNIGQLKSLYLLKLYTPAGLMTLDFKVTKVLDIVVKELPQLQEMRFETKYWTLTYLPQSKSMRLNGFYEKELSTFNVLWGIIKNLTSDATPEMYHKLSHMCPNLEYLDMEHYADPRNKGLGYFPKVTRLSFNKIAEVGNPWGLQMDSLPTAYHHQLQNITFNKGDIDKPETARLLCRLRGLRRINCGLIEPICIPIVASIPLQILVIFRIHQDDLLLFVRSCPTLRACRLGTIDGFSVHFYIELLDLLYINGVQPDDPFILRFILTSNFYAYSVPFELDASPKRSLLEIQLCSPTPSKYS